MPKMCINGSPLWGEGEQRFVPARRQQKPGLFKKAGFLSFLMFVQVRFVWQGLL
ncbi:MAG: hypothetical protein KME26_01480 [Oscillatoria princeps RMCB-10]|nr:hypothetical protein [Oscillatoria princeps RMCB-10]